MISRKWPTTRWAGSVCAGRLRPVRSRRAHHRDAWNDARGNDVDGLVAATCGQAQKAEAAIARLNKDFRSIRSRRRSTSRRFAHASTCSAAMAPGPWRTALDGAIPAGIQTGGIPLYLRGTAYLMNKQGPQAAAEFQRFTRASRGAVTFALDALSVLGLARAHAMAGNTEKARPAYQDFLTMWKDADPDLPVLKAAKQEYANPHRTLAFALATLAFTIRLMSATGNGLSIGN